jgi:hypothetical protein
MVIALGFFERDNNSTYIYELCYKSRSYRVVSIESGSL